MATYAPTAPARERSQSEAPLHPYTLAVGVIALVQGLVVGALGLAGDFYLDDVDMSAEAARHPFGWHYLTLPLNDHLTPGLRAVYWFSAHFAPYDNTVTVVGRVLGQAVATVLMGYLLAQLVGRRRAALVALGLYAFSPLLVPSLLSLSSGVNLIPTHIGVLALLICHVRFEATRRLTYALGGAVALLGALLFWEKAVLALALPPLLTLLYLGWRALWRSWKAWLVYLAPVVGFFAWYLLGDYPKAGSTPSVGSVWSILRDAWLHSLGPSLVGGPWTWFTTKPIYYGVAAPGWVVTVAGQVAVVVVTVVAIRRNGFAAVRAWLLMVPALLGTAVLLAAGRLEYVGGIIARNFHYLSELSIPLVLVMLLLLVPPVAFTAAGRALPAEVGTDLPEAGADVSDAEQDGSDGTRDVGEPGLRAGLTRRVAIVLVVVVAGYALSYGVTVRNFEHRWTQNPIGDYLANAEHDLGSATDAGPIAVYDTVVPGTVATLLQTNRRTSEILRPLHPAVRWDDAERPLSVFDTEGHLRPARFVEEAQSADVPGLFCAHPLEGVGTVTITLSRRLTRPDSFVRLEYLAQGAAKVTVALADADTRFRPRRNAELTLQPGGFKATLLGTPNKALDRLIVTSTDPDAVACFSARAGHAEPVS